LLDYLRPIWAIATGCISAAIVIACAPSVENPGAVDLTDLGRRYAAAWSSQDPDRLASFYAEDGSLSVNGATSAGRPAIRATAAGFMEAFPDMRVVMDSVRARDGGAVFHWRWSGTNTGPGGTGEAVDLHGYEEWTFGTGGLLSSSVGHFDAAEYERQVSGQGLAP
jgi:uncharacterized protein (TIGR02246 family)